MRHLTVVLLAGAVLTLGACQSGWTWRVGICPWWTRARPTHPSTTPTSRSVKYDEYQGRQTREIFAGALAGALTGAVAG